MTANCKDTLECKKKNTCFTVTPRESSLTSTSVTTAALGTASAVLTRITRT